MKLKLPVFFHTDETANEFELGVKYNITECEVRQVVFYDITAIAPFFKDGKEFCTIHTPSGSFIARRLMSEVEKLIDVSKQKEYFLS